MSRGKTASRVRPSRPHPELDELDHRIIDLLSQDARVSNREIAEQLGVTEGTIRGRVKRLEQENCIRFTAITNVSLANVSLANVNLGHANPGSVNGGNASLANARPAGAPRVVLIGIQCVHEELRALSERIAAMPEIRCVIITLGRYDILAIGLFTALEDVVEVANNRILALPGVRHVETSIAAKTLKYDYRVAKIT